MALPGILGAMHDDTLDAAQRNRMRSSTFGLPSQRKYPMPDDGHARDALARASEELHKGNISDDQYREIVAKAHRMLGMGR